MILNKFYIFWGTYVILVFSIFVLNITISSYAYYGDNLVKNGIITLGQASIKWINSSPLFSDDSIIPGEEIIVDIGITNSINSLGTEYEHLIDLYIRVKPEFSVNEVVIYDIITPVLDNSNLWVVGEDGYYYLKRILHKGETLIVFNKFLTSNLLNAEILESGVNVTMFVEGMQILGDFYKSLWETAPLEWITVIENT